LKFRDPCPEVRVKFMKMFKAGHSPAQALHNCDLREEYEDTCYKVCSDRAACPNVQWVHRLYKAAFEAEFGPSGGSEMAEQLKKTVSEYNMGENRASLTHVGNDTVIAVVFCLHAESPHAAECCTDLLPGQFREHGQI